MGEFKQHVIFSQNKIAPISTNQIFKNKKKTLTFYSCIKNLKSRLRLI